MQYGNGDFAPGIKYGDEGKWKCGHNLLLAHAKAVKLFRDRYKAPTKGKIGMALWSEWSEPWSGTPGGEVLHFSEAAAAAGLPLRGGFSPAATRTCTSGRAPAPSDALSLRP
jgi:beta-glucosidase/6-phospho-beta-glucosidase/beta-galactosidase